MKSIFFSLLLMIALFITGCFSKPVGYIDKNEIYLNYIFYESLRIAYNNDTVFLSDATPGVYMDLSGFTILEDLGDFLKNEAKRRANAIEPVEKEDYNGKKATFFRLLENYNDKELSKKILKEIRDIRRKRGY